MDSYHYTNHQVTDELCHKWCNPAPTNGSAPNIVVAAYNKKGKSYYKRAFTQACEQLNSWLGGFESILKCMRPENFNWFLHTMLFYHTRHVLEKMEQKGTSVEDDSDENEGEDENENEDNNEDEVEGNNDEEDSAD